jgi:hypothetical protein
MAKVSKYLFSMYVSKVLDGLLELRKRAQTFEPLSVTEGTCCTHQDRATKARGCHLHMLAD